MSLVEPGFASLATWTIAGAATAGVIARPFRWPEAVWAVAGAVALLLLGLLTAGQAWAAVAKGVDVYLFLAGMMLLSETARQEGLFDWLAAFATGHAKGSPHRLFALVYGVGALVTVFLSNDATAVVLTPAVYAATRAARVQNPLPYLYICAFVANAASFVLPISNPANLVMFREAMPDLRQWLALFTLPSLAAVAVTFAVLWATQRRALAREQVQAAATPALGPAGRIAAGGLATTAVALAAASWAGADLGWPTFAAGFATLALAALFGGASPRRIVGGVSWEVLPLVAGLFVLVEALGRTGMIDLVAHALEAAQAQSAALAGFGGGMAAGLASNVLNNLPVGLIASEAVHAAGSPSAVAGSVLIGVDLGPNISVTGSLATILWLTALRREGVHVSAWRFLGLGLLVTTPSLLLALAAMMV